MQAVVALNAGGYQGMPQQQTQTDAVPDVFSQLLQALGIPGPKPSGNGQSVYHFANGMAEDPRGGCAVGLSFTPSELEPNAEPTIDQTSLDFSMISAVVLGLRVQPMLDDCNLSDALPNEVNVLAGEGQKNTAVPLMGQGVGMKFTPRGQGNPLHQETFTGTSLHAEVTPETIPQVRNHAQEPFQASQGAMPHQMAEALDEAMAKAMGEPPAGVSENPVKVTLPSADGSLQGLASPIIQEGLTSTVEAGAPRGMSEPVARLVEQLAYQVQDGVQTLEISLKPETLGKVQIRLVMENGEMRAVLRTTHRQAEAVITSQLSLMQEALRDKGVRLVSLEMAPLNLTIQPDAHGQQPGTNGGKGRRGRQEPTSRGLVFALPENRDDFGRVQEAPWR